MASVYLRTCDILNANLQCRLSRRHSRFHRATDSQAEMKTILIVDESPEIRAALRAALETHGYTVLEASYLMGVEAMATCNSDVRAVILDENVPWGLGQSARSSLPLAVYLSSHKVKIVYHSADPYLSHQAREFGLCVVEKGSGIKELLEAVEGV